MRIGGSVREGNAHVPCKRGEKRSVGFLTAIEKERLKRWGGRTREDILQKEKGSLTFEQFKEGGEELEKRNSLFREEKISQRGGGNQRKGELILKKEGRSYFPKSRAKEGEEERRGNLSRSPQIPKEENPS